MTGGGGNVETKLGEGGAERNVVVNGAEGDSVKTQEGTSGDSSMTVDEILGELSMRKTMICHPCLWTWRILRNRIYF